MLSAMQGMMHMPTRKRVIYNCGLDSGHFSADPHFLEPPFNMVHFDQIWDHFDEPLC
jgi:hypothetical protein